MAGALKKLARDNDATLFMTLLAGWFTLLRRYTGQDDTGGEPDVGGSRGPHRPGS